MYRIFPTLAHERSIIHEYCNRAIYFSCQEKKPTAVFEAYLVEVWYLRTSVTFLGLDIPILSLAMQNSWML